MTRREELLRERSLVASHLAWLDLELARLDAARGEVSTPSAPAPSPAPILRQASPTAPSAEEQALTQRLMQEQVENSSKSVGEVKRGCFLVFAAAVLVLGGAVFLGYWFKYRH